MAGKDHLKPYCRKRNFRKTAEPKGRAPCLAALSAAEGSRSRAQSLAFDLRQPAIVDNFLGRILGVDFG